MGIFDDLDIDESKELQEDKIGSGERINFNKIERTGIYGFTIKNAYADASQIKEFQGKESGGALNVTLELEGPEGSLKTFEFVSAGVQKGRKPTFVYDKYRKLHFILTGNVIKNIPTENGPVMVWDNEARQEVEKTKAVITAWIGKKIKAAVCRTIEDKYNADGEMKDFIVVQSFLDDETSRSFSEMKEGKADAVYATEFLQKRDDDFIIDKRKLTKTLPIPIILTKVEKDAIKNAEKEAEFGGGDAPEIDINEDEPPF